jgi:uncharacterized protein (DUF2267 family)
LSREESSDIARAVLEGLAGQLSDGEARRLAADLPGLAQQLQAPRRRKKEAHPVRLHDFIRQVSQRTGLTGEEDRAGAGAVPAVLREALGEEEYRHLTGQLPAEYTRLVRQSADRAPVSGQPRYACLPPRSPSEVPSRPTDVAAKAR